MIVEETFTHKSETRKKKAQAEASRRYIDVVRGTSAIWKIKTF